MSPLLTPLFRVAAGLNRGLPILLYHQILPEPDPLRPEMPDAARFAAQLDWLGSVYRILPLDEGVHRLQADDLPARALCITFDDGYQDNLDIAAPLLCAKGMHATFFLTTAWLEGGLMFNDSVIEALRRWPGRQFDGRPWGLPQLPLDSDAARAQACDTVIRAWKYLPCGERDARVAALTAAVPDMPARCMLDAPGIRALRGKGMEIGGHTHEHPILATLAEDAARDTMSRNKRELEAILGERLRYFAYPNGKPGQDYRAEHSRLARELGYEAAFSTALGAARPGPATDLFQLPRFLPSGPRPARFLAQSLRYAMGPGLAYG